MTSAAALGRRQFVPALLGFGSLLIFILLVEVLIRVGVINRYIVPMPSQIAMSFGRVISEEDIFALFLVIFGRSAMTIIMMGFVAGLPPVILKTLEGLSGTRRVLINVGRSFKLGPTQMFVKILFPAALPTIFVGLRLGLIFTLINVVGVEFLINFGGLGQLINDLAERYDLPGTYAAICFVILVSVFFFIITERVERWLRPVD